MKGMKKLYGKGGGSRSAGGAKGLSSMPPMGGGTVKVGPLRTTFTKAVGKR